MCENLMIKRELFREIMFIRVHLETNRMIMLE